MIRFLLNLFALPVGISNKNMNVDAKSGMDSTVLDNITASTGNQKAAFKEKIISNRFIMEIAHKLKIVLAMLEDKKHQHKRLKRLDLSISEKDDFQEEIRNGLQVMAIALHTLLTEPSSTASSIHCKSDFHRLQHMCHRMRSILRSAKQEYSKLQQILEYYEKLQKELDEVKTERDRLKKYWMLMRKTVADCHMLSAIIKKVNSENLQLRIKVKRLHQTMEEMNAQFNANNQCWFKKYDYMISYIKTLKRNVHMDNLTNTYEMLSKQGSCQSYPSRQTNEFQYRQQLRLMMQELRRDWLTIHNCATQRMDQLEMLAVYLQKE